MRIYTTISPLFVAEGTNQGNEDDPNEVVIFLYHSYDGALAKGKELLHQSYSNVSVYRAAEGDLK